MKVLSTIVAFFLIFSTGIAGSLQTTPMSSGKIVADQSFAFFRVHRMADDASLNWGISNPLQAVSFVIERSYDGFEFETIQIVSANGNASYKYRDNTVFPGITYYRITCVNADGSEAVSEVVDVRIVKRR